MRRLNPIDPAGFETLVEAGYQPEIAILNAFMK
jgi:ketol-acid reductoisomerase